MHARDERSHADADGRPQPLTPDEAQAGYWACPLWHVWQPSALNNPSNVAGEAAVCPICHYRLWRIQTVERTEQAVRIVFDERDA